MNCLACDAGIPAVRRMTALMFLVEKGQPFPTWKIDVGSTY